MISQQMLEKIVDEIKSNEPFESMEEGIKFLCSLKDTYNLSWEDVAAVAYSAFNIERSESYFRKNFGDFTRALKDKAELDAKLLEIKKERVKLSDERTQNNIYVRKMAREETLKEIALEAAREIGKNKKLLTPGIPLFKKGHTRNEAILCISDWHVGLEIDNALNTYNIDIAKQRVAKLRDEVVNRLRRGDISKLHIVNLGDMIAGRIHLQLRLSSRVDVITQTMIVSEMIAELLTSISSETNIEMDYHSCIDNHSRLEPIKEDAMDLESLCRITDWYLKERLKDYEDIKICENTQGSDIITFDCKGHKVVGVHGDKDKRTQLEHLQLMLGYACDLLLISHLHHPWMEESNSTKIMGNGALMGTDEYARRLRLNSKASQNFIVVSDKNVCEELHIIDLQ